MRIDHAVSCTRDAVDPLLLCVLCTKMTAADRCSKTAATYRAPIQLLLLCGKMTAADRRCKTAATGRRTTKTARRITITAGSTRSAVNCRTKSMVARRCSREIRCGTYARAALVLRTAQAMLHITEKTREGVLHSQLQ